MHDTNDWAFVHMDDTSYSTNIDVSTAMIIYALNPLRSNNSKRIYPTCLLSNNQYSVPSCDIFT
jgi:hypothetical protein